LTNHIRTEQRPNTIGLDPTVWILEYDNGSGIEVWPALGFNCYRWYVRPRGENSAEELLDSVPEFFEQEKPTRSGFPILFPFPNRIRAGRFRWLGQDYHLAANDPSGKNAIHGFACHAPWQVVDTNESECSITAEHVSSPQNPWPASYRLQLTYRLAANRLRLEARVKNTDSQPLPFGLGYHPYFRASLLGDANTIVQVPASASWELEENLPTGKVIPVAGQRDLRAGRKVAGLELDDVLTDLDPACGVASGPDATPHAAQPLVLRGSLHSPARRSALEMWTSPEFREMVVFTPPHRQAICLEPYTCVTDAINLRERNIDAGWRVLGSGESWTGVVEMVLRHELG